MVRRNNIKQDKNDQFYSHIDILEPINTTINILSSLLLTEFVNPNSYINYINIIEKTIL